VKLDQADFIRAGDMPPEALQGYLDAGFAFFEILKDHGNGKDDVYPLCSMVIERMQEEHLKHAETMDSDDVFSWSILVLVLATTMKVCINGNPLYNTEALTDQLRHQFEQLLRSSKAIDCKPS
jgi:hypothetical protein